MTETTVNPQIPILPISPGGRCTMHNADGTSYYFHCDTNQPYTSTPPVCSPVEGPTERPDTCIETVPEMPKAPPSAGIPEMTVPTGTLPHTGANTEPLLGFAGFLIVAGVPLVLIARRREQKTKAARAERMRRAVRSWEVGDDERRTDRA